MRIETMGDHIVGCRWCDSKPEEVNDFQYSVREQELIEKTCIQIEEYLEGKRREFDIPTCLQGTEFQKRIWTELEKIPYGATITYGDLAHRIGRPGACRAVANACGANPIPIIVPCHRVVASGGKPGGYTGGLDIKQRLLSIEKNLFFHMSM